MIYPLYKSNLLRKQPFILFIILEMDFNIFISTSIGLYK